MNRGVYPVLTGSLAQEHRIQVLSNNMANVNSYGFKRVEPVFASVLGSQGLFQSGSSGGPTFQPFVTGPQGVAERVFVQTIELNTNFSGGQLRQTKVPLDLAIQGDGMFEIMTPQGPLYTRNGSFHMDEQRRLLNATGHPVMGDKGEIKLKPGEVRVVSGGTIQVDGEAVARITVVEFPKDKPLQSVGQGLFVGENGKPVKDPNVLSGYLEESNVNPFTEMVNLIEVMRSYESAQKIIQTFDHMAELSIEEVGRVA
ncbi:MAG: flagellar hook-basal body protein [Nitrospirota bacterium]